MTQYKQLLMTFAIGAALCIGNPSPAFAEDNTSTNQLAPWISRPLSLAEALNLALKQNGDISRAKNNLEAAYGVVVQTRAVAIPTIQATGDYTMNNAVETFPFPGSPPTQNHAWNAKIQLIQNIYAGGRITSAFRVAKLTKEQALLQYQTILADALLQVRIAYYDILQTAEQIVVQEASVKLLTNELDDQKRRYEAGTVPRFNVLRAEVELANQRPQLIQARNANRIAKNNLISLLGYVVPREVWEDIPMQLTDKLEATPYQIQLPVAIAQALQNRSELAALQKAQALRNEDIIAAKAGYKPLLQGFAGYNARNTLFQNDLTQKVDGFVGGVQMTWNIFDGLLTRGKVQQAKALHEAAGVDVDNEIRTIELQVRTEYSNFLEARETLESQKKVQETAEEALRLATARNEAGTGTQLDVLQAQTSLTQARSTQVQALRNYEVARARLERAIGANIMQSNEK